MVRRTNPLLVETCISKKRRGYTYNITGVKPDTIPKRWVLINTVFVDQGHPSDLHSYHHQDNTATTLTIVVTLSSVRV